MHPPSPLLLRSLRTSILRTTPAPSSSPYSFLQPTTASRFLAQRSLKRTSTVIRTYSSESSNNGPSRRVQPPSRSPPRRASLSLADLKPKSNYRGPPPEDADAKNMTDLNSLDILSGVAAPATAIDACHHDGFQLNNGLRIADGNGCLLVDGEAFIWRPWEAASGGAGSKSRSFVNEKGQWEVPEGAWGALRLLWPKPDLLILGLGPTMRPISPETRRHINELGIRVEVQDTRNAAAQFNLLATERGVQEVAAAMIPIG
ncbi:hypothetical protein FQN49_002872 [Arthroderma sp. PD_2]|nr:hypothetical protein FQN49_002872 [Arthroderma sp. PD_2]